MNKLEGFLHFKSINIPTVEWREYRPGAELSSGRLWTVRSAVFSGDDYNLPRLVGADARSAAAFAGELYKKMNGRGMVIYYPFFTARLSGTVCVSAQKTLIECVKGDLWNLVTDGKADFSGEFAPDGELSECRGESLFTTEEQEKLLGYCARLRSGFRGELAEGLSVLAEWSFATDCDADKNPTGAEYPVFFELRIIK